MKTIIGKEFAQILIPQIDAAKNKIDILMFDWRWYPNDPGNPVQLFNQSIVRAVRRGVCVRVIANFQGIVTTLAKVGVQAKKISTKNTVHAKTIIIDDKIVIVGSHNFSVPAFTTNYEVSTMFEVSPSDNDYLKFFNSLWQL